MYNFYLLYIIDTVVIHIYGVHVAFQYLWTMCNDQKRVIDLSGP
jgi:hypothetical protein